MPQQPEASAHEEVRAFDRPMVMIPLLALIAAVGGLFGSFTVSANLLVLAVGGTMVWISLSGRVLRRTAPRRLSRGALWWLVPLLVLALTELYAFLHTPREDYPTLSLLFDPVFERYLPRAAGYFGWLAGFWALVRR
jgi:hypothetical protein